MRKRLTCLVLTTLFSLNCLAVDKDYCEKMPGYWLGVAHLSDAVDCESYGSCHPLSVAIIEHQKNEFYKIAVSINMNGKVKTMSYPIQCINGEIKLPISKHYEVDGKCDKFNNCFSVMKTDIFLGEYAKRG